VRLCKGIYVESEEIQAKDPGEVGRSYLDLLARLLDRGAFVGIATHDEGLVEGALSIVGSRRLGPDRYEFQTLLGVRPRLAGRLIAGGHGVRVYVPYGRDWEAYSLRRLRENPAIARHVIAALAGLG
jgi:proline dehydrogenase